MRTRHLLLAMGLAAALVACDQNMTKQEKLPPFRASSLFGGKAFPEPVAGSVARDADDIPAPMPAVITPALLERGRERFGIFCTPCHGAVGDGHGIVVERGFPAPPSFHIDRLRNAPASHFYDVITNGYGVMYSYADRVPPADRWAIAAYIRALQLSQHATAGSLSPQDRQALAGAPP